MTLHKILTMTSLLHVNEISIVTVTLSSNLSDLISDLTTACEVLWQPNNHDTTDDEEIDSTLFHEQAQMLRDT